MCIRDRYQRRVHGESIRMKVLVLVQFTKDVKSRTYFLFEDLTKAYEFVVKSFVNKSWRESAGEKTTWIMEREIFEYVDNLEELGFLINEEKDASSKFEFYDKEWIKKSMAFHVRQLLSKE
eukprot:TRINITY_DN279_c0_g1_i1.p1 TRINITY_DN279_c0_g1~~TRINITY_DN279_c0_g1_i1.p1  ORF type:complete len:141 (+),score=59.93 TRINITY_DN279_c0_g1_i1:61-423(+)